MTLVLLRDGHLAEVRVANNDEEDRGLITDLYRRASRESLYLRFFRYVNDVSERSVGQLVFAEGSVTLVCVSEGVALGVGTYIPVNDDTAEVSFLVDDAAQGNGIGTLLLEQLAEEAWKAGFIRFEADVLEQNRRMLDVMHDSGFDVAIQSEHGVMHLLLDIHPTEKSRAMYDRREKLAVAAALAARMNRSFVHAG